MNLEKGEYDAMGMPRLARTRSAGGTPKLPAQLSLFVQPDPIRAELKKIRIDRLTPLEALNVLDELKKKADTTEES